MPWPVAVGIALYVAKRASD